MHTKTHVYIIEQALKLAKPENIDKKELIKGAIKADGTTKIEKLFKVGSHFYNPKTKKGLYFFGNAKTKGLRYFKKAIKNNNSFYLGIALHLLADLATPAHSQNTNHFLYCNDLENYLLKNKQHYKKPTLIKKQKIEDYFEDMAIKTSKLRCEKTGFIIGIKYFLFKTKKHLPLNTIKKQAGYVLWLAISYTAGLLHYHWPKKESKTKTLYTN